MMLLIDMIMVGHYRTEEIAFLNIGYSLTMPLLVIGLGLLSGTLVLCAHNFGAGDTRYCGDIWRYSLPYAVFIGFIGFIIALAGEEILIAFGQKPELAAQGGRIMQITGLGLPAFMVLLTTAFFLEGIKRPTPWMIVMLIANAGNLAL
ncbi:MAG: MATE family efflux transporter, partial [Planctomycetes bacterium]|nr:MATE family efflux transporter [Planctomycetota bacterium]